MSSTLALSALIARMSHAELRALIGYRRVLSPASIVDPLGLALEYLRSDSISRAVAHLDTDTLAALSLGDVSAMPPQIVSGLRGRALIGFDEQHDSFVALPEVQSAVSAALMSTKIRCDADSPTSVTPGDSTAGSPGQGLGTTSLKAASHPDSSETVDTTGWYGQAVASVRISAALLRALRSEPAKMNRKGIVATIAVRTLADALSLQAHEVATLLHVLEWAGLTVAQPDSPTSSVTRLYVTPESEKWSQLSYDARWLILSEGIARSIPPEVHATRSEHPRGVGWASATGLRERYPLLPDVTAEHAARGAAAADAIGATVNGIATPAFEALFNGDTESAADFARSEIPAPAAGVYVQPDLTVIVPGPIEAAAEGTLFDFTEIDQLGAAAVLRITQRSLERALRIGYSADAIRDSLTQLSLTGIPQPLDFILTDLQRDRPNLAPVLSGARAVAAAWAQKHASAHSQSQLAGNRTTTVEPASNSLPADPQIELAHRVFEAAHLAPGGGDLSRLLELAIRDRNMVQVTAAAGSDVRTFTLLPLAVTGGRLRATDQTAGVERTLPLTAITMVIPA